MKLDVKSTIHNHFDIELIDKNDNVKQTAHAYNVVTNYFYTRHNAGYGTRLTNICLGTGTGTPSVTDTRLFTELYSCRDGGSVSMLNRIDDLNYSFTVSYTFSENEAIGLITEIGIGDWWNNHWTDNIQFGELCTHAMITDAEGHVISVDKTNRDRLHVTATLYISINLPNYYKQLPFCTGGLVWSRNQENTVTEIDWNDNPNFWINWLCGIGNVTGIADRGIRFGLAEGQPIEYRRYNEVGYGLASAEITNGFRLAINGTPDSGDFPSDHTFQLKELKTPFGLISLGDATIFPQLPLELTLPADGTQTGFNFGIPSLLTPTAVYINDVLQSPSSYTWNGIDYTFLNTEWESTNARYLKRVTGSCVRGNFFGIAVCYNGATIGVNSSDLGAIFDFGEVITLRKVFANNASSYADHSVEVSTDGNTWTTYTVTTDKLNRILDIDPPIAARYVRYTVLNDETTLPWMMLCKGTPQLEFNTAPIAGSIIKIETASKYPIKNANWKIDQFVMDVTISRA